MIRGQTISTKMKYQHPLRLLAVIIAFLLIFSTIGFTNGAHTNKTVNRFDNSRDTTYLSIVPSSQTVDYGETFSIIVHLDPGEPIIGVQIDLSFSASLIQCVDVGKADSIWFFFPPNIDNTNGEIHGAAVVVFGTTVTMPIDCFQITFTAQNIDGTSPLILHNIIVTNETADPITPVVSNGEVIVGTPGNLPPMFGTPSPANGSVDQPLSLTWEIPIYDLEGDPFSWTIECSNGQSNSGVGAGNGTKTLALFGLGYSTMYTVWVNATDPDPGSGLYTRRWYVFSTKANIPPYVPSDPYPANNSDDVPIDADLSWTGGDPDPTDTVTYDVYFGTSSSPPKVASNISTTTYDPDILSYNTCYYWKIVAWDNTGASTVGPRWQFRTTAQPNRPPYAPSNPNPPNGSTEIPVDSDLFWAGGDPDSGDTVTYDVYFDSANPPVKKIKSNTSKTTCVLEKLNYSQKYYWKVVAWDNHHNTNTSPVWSFTTKLDTRGPNVAITSPKKGWVHIHLLGGLIHRTFPILFFTLVIGPIDINVTASDSQSGMDRVEFYLDNSLMKTDYTEPYGWEWSEHELLFPYHLTVTAYDNSNNPTTYSMNIWKMF